MARVKRKINAAAAAVASNKFSPHRLQSKQARMMNKKKPETDEDNAPAALVKFVTSVLGDLLANNDVINTDELARLVVTEWRLWGDLSSLDHPFFDCCISTRGRRRNEVESLVREALQRDALLSHFTTEHCQFFLESTRQCTYNMIVEKVNSGHPKPVLDYPSLPAQGMKTASWKMDEIKRKRQVVEEAIKIWWRQIHQPEGKRLLEFTNDEAWLAILRHWGAKEWKELVRCITPSLAPDCFWKFLHMLQLQRWGCDKHYLKYTPLLKKWPKEFQGFRWELMRIAKEQESEEEENEVPISPPSIWSW